MLSSYKYLSKATADIDLAVDRAHSEIDLLREYRTRLIADVVTGKLDVRAAAANLPDQPDVDERLGGANGLLNGSDATAGESEPFPEAAEA